MKLNSAVNLLEALKRHPAGVTPRDLAARMRRNQTLISAQLGKLAMYGIIDRERVDVPGHACIAYRYSTKVAHA